MIYVASSWRNQGITPVVQALRGAGLEVFDFREEDGGGFGWREIDPEWQAWTPEIYRKKLSHDRAIQAFNWDMSHLKAADGVVLVLPCGRSAHLELGYAIGAGKPTCILLAPGEPELMYRAANCLALTIDEVLAYWKGGRDIEAGDSVHHYPSGEKWFLLGVNEGRGEVCPAGWPHTIARLNDCALIEKGDGVKAEELEARERLFGGAWDKATVKA